MGGCPVDRITNPCSLSPPLPLSTDTLVAVLERDTLGVREVRLFGAAVRWAEAETHRQQLQPTPENKRRVLGKALMLIRFPLMTIEEFAAGKNEIKGIILIFSFLPLLPLSLAFSCDLEKMYWGV